TVQRRPTRGRVTADHGAVRISRRWKPHYVRRSLSDGRVKFQRALSATRSFTLWTSIRPLPVWVERRFRRIARLTVSINWISSWANRNTPTAKDFLPTSLIRCLPSNGGTGRYTLFGSKT